MSSPGSIRNRINKIEAELLPGQSAAQQQQQQQLPQQPPMFVPGPPLQRPWGTPPTPPTLNFDRAQRGGSGGLGSGRGRPNLDIRIPPSGTWRPESEMRFQSIMEKSGMLKINDQIYKTSLADMQEMGELGSGTSGHVVKMCHKPSNTVIAVKQMRRTGNDEENKRIIMDLDVVLKSEKCRYIVKCLGCFITDADVWICMELMTTCFDKLQKKYKKPIPEQILGKVTVATVTALAYLKDQHNVIHRDVKPSNILIDDRGNIKLCDFGISGRLVDSNAKTRSAGCAAYMAPERIDPAKSRYDIRADVWSLGITLVELATALFPYRGCKTDFEVLTKVLTSSPPRLPEDQSFSPEFQDFVQRCLQKDFEARPKYPELLKHRFLQQAEKDTSTDVAGWFRNVAIGCGIQLTSPPQLLANAVGPGFASSSSLNSVSIQRPSSSASDQNRVPTPFESLTEAVQAQSNQQKQTVIASSIPIKSSNMPNHTSNSSSSNVDLHHQQQQLHTKLSNISLAPSAAPQTTSSSMPYDLRSPSPAHHLQLQQHQQQMQTPQAQYLKLQPNSAIVSSSTSSTVNVNLPDGNRKYKQSPFLPRRMVVDTNANAAAGSSSSVVDSPLLYGSPKKESTLSSLGQSLFKNLTTSPFSHRKSEQKPYKPPLPGEDGGGGMMLNGNRGGFSNPSSPLMLNRKMIDLNEDQQYKHLQGNTSPIVLQRFYHQQNQLRETKQYEQPSTTNPFYQQHQQQQPSGIPVKYSPLPSHRTVHHPSNPAFAATGIVGSYPQLVPAESSNIPTYQYQQLTSSSSPKHKTGFFNTFGRAKSSSRESNGGAGGSSGMARAGERCGSAGSEGGFPEGGGGGFYANHGQQLYGRQTLPEYGSAGYAMQGVSNGGVPGDGIKDDTGWFTSIADLAKRRFASFVKLNLATTGEKRPKDKHLQNQLLQQQQQQMYHQQPSFPFGSGNGATVAPVNHYGSNPFGVAGSSTGIPSAIPPSAAAHVLGNDRRHRSPDPPPRFNRGQSPLLLHRKLEKLGQSPILNQRFTSASPSPPLPPRRGSESVPGSPQHIRTRIHYTPEPHRRPYRTIDQ
ncbi:dual specificity mitogen-activated protein kinase kinase hemipterous isoform X1 [Culex quinquefasciatus]|uniref:dual specificity mitogen-activated protein kinase kinase hemipterous isoform X1 n=1 Tax=Culex quinquefasciatus TaxID=7176 RepID=UPI0018E3E227|nr:dual specificity mitogen-activated protein kinase kinase hemipterous isoform X1 [Culex quinquefasciatus]